MQNTQKTGEQPLGLDARFCAPESVLKGQVSRTLKELRKKDPSAKRSEAEEMLARIWGRPDWHALQKNARDAHGRGNNSQGQEGPEGQRKQKPAAFCPKTATRAEWMGLLDLCVDLGGENSIWKSRALSLAKGVVGVHFEEHPEGGLSAKQLRAALSFDSLARRIDPQTQADSWPQTVAGDAIRRHMGSLPKFWPRLEADPFSLQIVLEQHGYVQMQFTESVWEMLEALDELAGAVISRAAWVGARPVLAKGEAAADWAILRHTWLDGASAPGQHSLFGWAAREHERGRDVLTLGDIGLLGIEALVPMQREAAIHWLRQAEKMDKKAREIERALGAGR